MQRKYKHSLNRWKLPRIQTFLLIPFGKATERFWLLSVRFYYFLRSIDYHQNWGSKTNFLKFPERLKIILEIKRLVDLKNNIKLKPKSILFFILQMLRKIKKKQKFM